MNRRLRELKNRRTLVFVTAATILLILSLGFWDKKFTSSADASKVHDLYLIEARIQAYYKGDTANANRTQELPSDLDDLGLTIKKVLRGKLEDYTYKKQGNFNYELCTTFQNSGQKNSEIYVYKDYGEHASGYTCFQLDAYQNNLFKSKYGNSSPYN